MPKTLSPSGALKALSSINWYLRGPTMASLGLKCCAVAANQPTASCGHVVLRWQTIQITSCLSHLLVVGGSQLFIGWLLKRGKSIFYRLEKAIWWQPCWWTARQGCQFYHGNDKRCGPIWSLRVWHHSYVTRSACPKPFHIYIIYTNAHTKVVILQN